MMHVRGCYCDECLPAWPVVAPVRLDKKREMKRQQNARAYMKRKLKGAAS
jgi:hypothetical protein